MDKVSFLALKPDDKVLTFEFGTATVYDWACNGIEVILTEFNPPKPRKRCIEFNRHEIKEKL